MCQKFVFILILQNIVWGLHGQSIDQLETNKEQLIKTKQSLLDSIEKIDLSIQNVQKIINKLKYGGDKKKVIVSTRNKFIYEDSSFGSDKIPITSEEKSNIELIGYENSKLKVYVNGKVGYLSSYDFYERVVVNDFIEVKKEEKKEREKLLIQQKIKLREEARMSLEEDSVSFTRLLNGQNLELDEVEYSEYDPMVYQRLIPPYSIEVLSVADSNYFEVKLDFFREKFQLNSFILLDIERSRERWRTQNREAYEKDFQAYKMARIQELTNEFGYNAAVKIFDGKIWIGMTKKMILASWGEPIEINRTVTSYQTKEQWVYGTIGDRVYLYVEDEVLTAFQD